MPPSESESIAQAKTERPSQSSALYQTLFELMPGSVVVMNEGGTVLDANPSFCRQIGFSREELVGRHVSAFSKDTTEDIKKNLSRLLAGEVLEHEVVNVHKDGSLRHYELRETAITLPDGTRGILALSNDVTQRVVAQKEKLELQRQLLHTEKLRSLGLMAGGIAHDFNNLLAAIIGNIELGMIEAEGKPNIQDMLREGLAAANRAAHLTRQMLAYSGRSRFATSEQDLNTVIRGMEELLRATISKKASLELNLAPMLPPIESETAQLQQILLNLVTNSSEALEDRPGIIGITTAARVCDASFLNRNRTENQLKPGRYVVLEIADSGCGMTDEVQRQLFDPFFTTKFFGRGLGVSAVLGTVRAHGGGIIISSGVNEGTTMTILFPVPVKSSVAPPHTEPLALPKMTGTVLVADDEVFMRSMVERLFTRAGLRVMLAADGIEAVEMYKRHAAEITFVVLDFTMPKLDGVKTLAEMQRYRPNVKAILTSGYSEAGIAENSLQQGFVRFMTKPYEARILLEVARQICDGEL